MIYTLDQTVHQIKDWQVNQKIVLATGVFDILHIEHMRFLKKAKALGGKLVVGIETDTRVSQIKGKGRPINPASIRLEQLDLLKPVDISFLLPEEFSSQKDWESFMAMLHPDYYAVSSHSSYLENKQAICQNLGIELKIVHPHNPTISTTQLSIHSRVLQEKE